MLSANFNTYASYTTDSVYQWEKNRVLSVKGLNLSSAPEIHFSNANMDKAIVRQSTMVNHVVSCGIPNSLLQYPLPIKAHIGIYEGNEFKVIEELIIPVNGRKRPADYQIEDTDEEIYSFNKLLNALSNKADSAVVNARIDNIIANANKTDGNSELVDMRYGADGKTYPSAGAAMRAQIKHQLDKYNTYYREVELLKGSINGDSDTYRYHVLFNHPTIGIKINTSNDYYYGLQGYDDTSFENKTYDSGWKQGDTEFYNLDSSLYYNLEIRRADDQKMTEDDYYAITVMESVDLTHIIARLSSDSELATHNIHLLSLRHNNYYNRVELLDGSINGSSNPYRFHALFDEGVSEIKIETSVNYTYGLQGYDTKSYSNRVYDSGWRSGSEIFTGLDSSLYYNLEIRKTDETETMIDGDKERVIVYQNRSLTTSIDNLTSEMNNRIEPQYDSSGDFIKSIAHRGYSIEAPENTAPAFIMAKEKGFTYVETDIQVTKDGKYVCVHDELCTRYTGGEYTGAVSDYTLAELQSTDWGGWKSDEWIGTKILTFEDFVLLCKRLSLNMYIELKFTHAETDVEYYVNYIKSLGMLDKTSWLSNQYSDWVRKYDPNARVAMTGGVLASDEYLEIYKQTYLTGDDNFFLDMDVSIITKEVSDKLSEMGIPLEVWTVNDVDTMMNLISLNIKGITSDCLIVGKEIYKHYYA